MIVVVDDPGRENEGDLVCAAAKVTPEIINFMAKYGRGLICLPITGERLDQLARDRGLVVPGAGQVFHLDPKDEGVVAMVRR